MKSKMNKNYDLVLIDSGFFSEKNKNVDVYKYKKNKNNENEEWFVGADDDQVGHGTSVLSIISNQYKGSFAVFKAFDLEVQNNLPIIVSALEFIYNHISCRIIQMSFGMRGYYKELEDICTRLYKKGIIIIAAYDNCGAMSYPAAFEFVIGVDGDPYCKTKDDFNVFDNGYIDIQAKSGYQIVEKNSITKGFDIKPGNSFATSYVSLKILQSEKEIHTKQEAMRLFYPNYSMKISNDNKGILCKRVAIFPLNKENYSIVNYADMAISQIVDIYDIKYTSNVGRVVYSLNKTKKFIVKNIDKCEWDTFDTLVIGHVRELSKLLNKNLKRSLLEECLKNGKDVYCYDSYDIEDYKEKFRMHGLKLIVADEINFRDMFGKLYQIKTPILSVMGTSKKQGKFTLQMQIRRVLLQKNVKIGQMGTEPTGLILGCDEILPSGYDSNLSGKNASYIIQAYNKQMHKLDIKGYDVILVGAQSGFYPHYFFNVSHININSFAYLYGVMPDGIILVVNYRDSIEYIRKSINALESLVSTKVFLIALYAFKTEVDNVINVEKEYLSEEEIYEFEQKILEEFGLKTIVSGDFRYDQILFEEIIRFYCEE